MRIALVSEFLPSGRGGLRNHVLALAQVLKSRHHEVTLVGRSGREKPDLLRHIPFLGLLPARERGWKERSLKVVLMSRRRWEGRRVRRVLRSLLTTHEVVHYHGQLITAVARMPLNVILTTHDYAGVCPKNTLFRTGDQCDTTNSRDCGSCYFETSLDPLRRLASGREVTAWRRAVLKAIRDRVIVFVSEAQRQLWEKYLGASLEDQSVVVENFLPAPLWREPGITKGEARRLLGLSPTGPLIVLASFQGEYKGVDQFLKLWRSEMSDGMVTVVLGAGAESEPNDRESQAPTNLLRPGWVSREQVIHYLRAADVLVLPSLWPEPWPTAVLEAVAASTPVVALRRGGLEEMAQRSEGWIRLVPTLGDIPGQVRATLDAGPPLRRPSRALLGANAASRLEDLYRSVLLRTRGGNE